MPTRSPSQDSEQRARGGRPGNGPFRRRPARRLHGLDRAPPGRTWGRASATPVRVGLADAEQLGPLRTFGVRAAYALRASARTRSLALELERTRALLAVVGQATAQFSLAHTLETAVERVSELLAVDSVAVYLRADVDRLVPAAARSLTGPHARVAERMLELSFGMRDRALIASAEISGDRRLRQVQETLRAKPESTASSPRRSWCATR